ncbi:MAG: UBA domain-containing protein [Armatimonadota bacterium]
MERPDSELENVDIIRSRFNVTYEEARCELAAADGDLVGALAEIEKNPPSRESVDLFVLGAEIADEVRRLVDGGPIRKLRVRYGKHLVAEKPVALTAMAALAVGAAAVLVSRLAIEVEKDGATR